MGYACLQFLTIIVAIGLHLYLIDRRLRTAPRGIAIGVVANLLLLLFLVLHRGRYDLYQSSSAAFYLKYSISALFLIVVLLLLEAFCYRRLEIRYVRHKWRVRDVILSLLIFLFVTAGGLIFFISRWLPSYFDGLTADQLFYILGSAGGGAQGDQLTDDVVNQILCYLILPTVGVGLTGLMFALQRSEIRFQFASATRPREISFKATRILSLFLSIAFLSGTVIYSTRALPVVAMVRSQLVSSNYLETNYVPPTSKNLKFPTQKRNLIHIYLESMENSYYDRAEGGYMAQNLMPDLAALTKENVSFSNTDKFGGPQQTYGAGHSVAAMINMNAGIPMKTSTAGGTQSDMAYPNLPTIGDLLYAQGYNTSFMQGADSEWGGLGNYYRKHGHFSVFDINEAKRRGLLPPDYKVFWGYEDDKLYEYAKAELTRLAGEHKPFYFILENADTHFPDGYLSPKATARPSEFQYGNVIFYSQGEVDKFVRWCQSQPFYENTTIVVTGDHRSMDKKFFAGWDPAYDRTIVNIFINSAQPKPAKNRVQNRQYAPFDFFPTILASIGVKIEGDRLGLGTNLYSDKQTFVEKDGLDTINERLQARSNFYDHAIVDQNVKPEELQQGGVDNNL